VRAEELVCMSDAFTLLDYSTEEFIQENILMMHLSHGGLSYNDLCSMPFEDHQKYCIEFNKLQKKMTEGKDED